MKWLELLQDNLLCIYLENAEGFDEYSKVGHRHKKLCRLSK